MANSLPPRQQGKAIWDLIKKRPIRASIFLIIIIVSIVASQKYDPIVIKYSAYFGDSARQIETLIIVNPNIEKREVQLILSPSGEVNDLGVDEAHAVDVSEKNVRSAKLSVLDRSVSLVSILRNKMDQSSIRIPDPIEIENANITMRRLAFAYLIGLLLLLIGFLQAITAVAGLLIFYQPGVFIRHARETFK